MLEDVKYECLKENPVKYEIMLLRDLYDNSYADIAKEYELSTQRVMQNYYQVKLRQARLYIQHLSIVHGYDNTTSFRELFNQAEDCYKDWQYAVAYLEKKYKTILDEYRAGEPGMPIDFLSKVPPLKKKWSNKMISEVIRLREVEKESYIEIGRKFNITKFKAESIYDYYYHRKFYAIIDDLKKKLGEKKGNQICDYYHRERSWCKPKRRYDRICNDYPEYGSKDSAGGKRNTPTN